MKKKLLLINSNKAWGGGEKWFFESALFLKDHFDISVISHKDSILEKRLAELKINTLPISVSNSSVFNPIKLYQFRDIIRQANPCIAILNLPRDVKIFAPLLYKLGCKKIIYRRGMNHPIKSSFLNNWLMKSQVSLFIANSLSVKKSIYQNIPSLESKIKVLYNGVQIPSELRNKSRKTKIILGNLGRLTKQKGQKDLIILAQKLIEKGYNFEIQIAGNGELESELKKIINELELNDYIKLVGHRNADIFLRTIDLFIFPSRFEGFSNALLEAQAYNVPTISYAIEPNEELVEHGKTGVLAAPFSIDDLYKQTIKLINDEDLAQVLRKNAKVNIKNNFLQSNIQQRMLEILNE